MESYYNLKKLNDTIEISGGGKRVDQYLKTVL